MLIHYVVAYKYVISEIILFLDEAEWDMKNMQIEEVGQGGKII